ncbi:hypothetical protein MDAP_000992 [Mitosporidium daphniae]|uniref:Uncharacterized protein n=1 Tax=Mitosporidium daphniae TaxID=1485682 RepID=A0A098VMX1_9MICR|nr:uncharacterized protein DI09_84p30 [Mitosporidium daphniae]KGG50164.1 hypothetical protein DI09_84p30 [Mitosporidium daphniae]|eukprot:XP_013236600.1 uncharacterized protein DI09_84p30 [Mitosporidium daphniae]
MYLVGTFALSITLITAVHGAAEFNRQAIKLLCPPSYEKLTKLVVNEDSPFRTICADQIDLLLNTGVITRTDTQEFKSKDAKDVYEGILATTSFPGGLEKYKKITFAPSIRDGNSLFKKHSIVQKIEADKDRKMLVSKLLDFLFLEKSLIFLRVGIELNQKKQESAQKPPDSASTYHKYVDYVLSRKRSLVKKIEPIDDATNDDDSDDDLAFYDAKETLAESDDYYLLEPKESDFAFFSAYAKLGEKFKLRPMQVSDKLLSQHFDPIAFEEKFWENFNITLLATKFSDRLKNLKDENGSKDTKLKDKLKRSLFLFLYEPEQIDGLISFEKTDKDKLRDTIILAWYKLGFATLGPSAGVFDSLLKAAKEVKEKFFPKVFTPAVNQAVKTVNNAYESTMEKTGNVIEAGAKFYPKSITEKAKGASEQLIVRILKIFLKQFESYIVPLLIFLNIYLYIFFPTFWSLLIVVILPTYLCVRLYRSITASKEWKSAKKFFNYLFSGFIHVF